MDPCQSVCQASKTVLLTCIDDSFSAASRCPFFCRVWRKSFYAMYGAAVFSAVYGVTLIGWQFFFAMYGLVVSVPLMAWQFLLPLMVWHFFSAIFGKAVFLSR